MKTNYSCMILAIIIFLGCAYGGNTRINREVMDTITIGRTTQRDVIKMFGYPESVDPTTGRPMLIVNQTELTNHLYRTTLKKYEDIPEGKYEVWTYFRGMGHTTGIGRRDQFINAMVVFDNRGIVYKKLFSDVSEVNFNPLKRTIITPAYEELN